MQVKTRIWVEVGEQAVFGEGLEELLEHIDRLGSISQGAASMKMSYREAWGRIKNFEERSGLKLLKKRVGGEEGGGASLTPEARRLLMQYRELRLEGEKAIHNLFQSRFGDG